MRIFNSSLLLLLLFFVSSAHAAPSHEKHLKTAPKATPQSLIKDTSKPIVKPVTASASKSEKIVISSAKKGISLHLAPGETPKRGVNSGTASDPFKLRKAPPSKGGIKRRGFMAKLKIDNRTNLFVDVFLDDAFYGTIAPFADLTVEVDSGETKLFAKAQFEDGSFTSWGIEDVELENATTWKLSP